MINDKESILRHYRQMRDEDFSTINPVELTDEGKSAYYQEKTRRSSTEYLENKAAAILARETESKISAAKRAAKNEHYVNIKTKTSLIIMKAGLIIVPIIGIISGFYCSQALAALNRTHDNGPLQLWGFVNFWGLLILQGIFKKLRYVILYVIFAFAAAILTH